MLQRRHTAHGALQVHGFIAGGRGTSRPAAARRLQLERHPQLARACTSEWLPPRLQQHQNRTRDTQRLLSKLEDILLRLLPVLVLEVPHASQLLMYQGVADASHSNKISRVPRHT